jgi:hypothetical protein
VSSMTRNASAPPTSLSAWVASSRSNGASSTDRPQRNGATGHNGLAQPARPSGRRFCARPARSAPPRRAGTSAASPVVEPRAKRR